MSEKLSMHDHGNCELCDQIESELAQARVNIETLERMNQAVRRALNEAIPGWEGSGAGIVESIGMLAQARADMEALAGCRDMLIRIGFVSKPLMMSSPPSPST